MKVDLGKVEVRAELRQEGRKALRPTSDPPNEYISHFGHPQVPHLWYLLSLLNILVICKPNIWVEISLGTSLHYPTP